MYLNDDGLGFGNVILQNSQDVNEDKTNTAETKRKCRQKPNTSLSDSTFLYGSPLAASDVLAFASFVDLIIFACPFVDFLAFPNKGISGRRKWWWMKLRLANASCASDK